MWSSADLKKTVGVNLRSAGAHNMGSEMGRMTTLTPVQLKANLEELLPLHDKNIEVAGTPG